MTASSRRDLARLFRMNSRLQIHKRCIFVQMRRYTTQEVAKTIGVGYQTLLRWLYSKQIAEPERMMYGGQNLRLWTKADIARARKYKVDGLLSRKSRKGMRRRKQRR